MLRLECMLGVLAAALWMSACDDAAPGQTADAGEMHAHEHEHADAPPIATSSLPSTRVVRLLGGIDETDVGLAVVVGRGRARLFFCGGPTSYATSTRWLEIAFDSEHLEYEAEGWHIHAHLVQGLVGEVHAPGADERMFRAGPYSSSTLSGLYEGKAACGRIGLIVTQASGQDVPVAQGACTGADDQPAQLVEPLDLGATPLQVKTQSGEIVALQPAELDPL